VLAVVVAEDELVNRLRAIVEAVNQRFAEVILERSFGPVCHRHANAAGLLIVLDVIRAEKQKIASVLRDDCRRPHRSARPRHGVRVEDTGMLGPRDEVRRGDRVEEQLLVMRAE
jgi:hypothetical protein